MSKTLSSITRKTFLVPVDFSRNSLAAVDHAVKLAREKEGRLLLVHVITDPGRSVPLSLRGRYYEEIDGVAREKFNRLSRRLGRADHRFMILRGWDAARSITEQAAKSRVSMIIMGSHGRTGLSHLVLGSVAAKTVRHARCPVLVVKERPS